MSDTLTVLRIQRPVRQSILPSPKEALGDIQVRDEFPRTNGSYLKEEGVGHPRHH